MLDIIDIRKLSLSLLLIIFSNSIFAAVDKQLEDELAELTKVEQVIEDLGHFRQVVTKFVEFNNVPITNIEQIYTFASEIITDENFSLKIKDPWGDKWIYGLTKEGGRFFVDSINYKKWREKLAQEKSEIKTDPYEDSSFGLELVKTDIILDTDDEPTKVPKNQQEEGVQYECQGLLITTNQISSDCNKIIAEGGAQIDGNVTSDFYSSGKYDFKPSEVTNINLLDIKDIQHSKSKSLKLDASKVSIFTTLYADSLRNFIGDSIDNINAKTVNDSDVVHVENLASYLITSQIAGREINLLGDKRIGHTTVATETDISFETVITTKGFDSAGDVSVGGFEIDTNTNTNTIDLADSSFKVEGDIGVKGSLYSNNLLFKGKNLNINPDTITKTSDLNFKIDDATLTFTTDNTSAIIQATDELTFKANKFVFTNTNNSVDNFVFRDASDQNILTMDAINNRVGINTTSTATLAVNNGIQANTMRVDMANTTDAVQITKNTPGQLLGFNDGSENNFGLYSTQTVGAGVGSIAFDKAGNLLLRTNNSGWIAAAIRDELFNNGGDEASKTVDEQIAIGETTIAEGLKLGLKDEFELTFITNSKTAITIAANNQRTTFFGDLVLGTTDIHTNTSIVNVDNIEVQELQGIDGGSYSFVLSTSTAATFNALRIRSGNDDYLAFDTGTNRKQILVNQTLTLGSSKISGSRFDINGGTIDDVTIGATTPASFVRVGSLTFENNDISNPSDNVIDFVDNDITTTDSFTFTAKSAIDFTGGNLIDVGAVTLDSINPQIGGSITININPGLVNALNIAQSQTSYINFDTASETITINADTDFGTNQVSGSNFILANGSIDNMVIGATTPAEATFTTLSATILGQALDANNQEISNINIISGTIDNVIIGATTPTNIVSVGSLTFTSSSITSSIDTISFDNNDLTTSGTFTGGVIINPNGNLTNIGNMELSSISANLSVSTIDINLTDSQVNALNITEGTNSYLNFDTIDGAELITVGQNINIDANTISGSNFNITGGTITGIASIALTDKLEVGDITIGSNTSIVSNSGIDFGSNNLEILGTLTIGGGLDLSGSDLALTVGGLIPVNNVISATDTLVITILDNIVDALKIDDDGGSNYLNFDSSTGNKSITVNQDINIGANTISGSSFNITGGNTMTGLTSVETSRNTIQIGDITFDGSGSNITSNSGAIDFDSNDLTTGGTVTAGNVVITDNAIHNAGDIGFNTLSAVGDTMVFNLTDNQMQMSALDIRRGNNSYLGFRTLNGVERIFVNQDIIIDSSKTLTANDVDINGGAIDNVAIGANSPATIVRVDNITINSNQITSSNGTITFGNNVFTNVGMIEVESINLNNSNLTATSSVIVNAISAAGSSIDIGTNGNTINIAGGALAVATNGDVSTSSDLEVGGSIASVNTIINNGVGIDFDGEDLSVIDTLDAGATTVTSLVSTGDVTVMGDLTVSTITNSGLGISFGNEDLSNIGTLDATTITVTSLISPGDLTAMGSLSVGTITSGGLGISFDGEDLSNIGTLEAGATTVTSLVSTGDVTVTGDLIVGTITNGGSGINFGSENLSNIGTLDATIITATSLSITDLSVGTITNPNGSIINFVGENLTTTGTLNAGAATFTSLNLGTTGDITAVGNITASGDLKVRTDRLVVDNIGVAIGKNAATSALDVVGTVRVDGNGGNFINFMLGVSAVGSIQLNGTGGVDYMTTSDRRIKTNIKDTSIDALHILSNLRIVDYNFKKYPNADSITGFIAQEAQEVFSPMVANISDNLLGIATAKLIPILVKGVQIQQQQLDAFSDNINLNDDNINLSKNLNINNINIADTNGNLKANNLTVKKDIITNNKFSIKRIDNLKNLMSVNSSKIADKNAEGYMSVKDLYLSGRDEWLSTLREKVVISNDILNLQCSGANIGDARVLGDTGKLYICLGNKGWKIIKS